MNHSLRRSDRFAVSRFALSAVALALSLTAFSGSARAGLFDDDEARRAILDMRARVDQSNEQNRQRIVDLQTQMSSQLEQMRRSLLDINTQLETMRSEVARLRGQDEQTAKSLSDLQQRTANLQQGVDDRMKKLEPQTISLDGKDFTVDPEEKAQFDAAVNTLRTGDFPNAAAQFTAFNKRWPTSGYHETALFWLGNALYGKRDYTQAITTFRTLVGNSPTHARAPEAMLSIANCQLELKDNKSARRTLDELLAKYPKSEAANAGRERLASIK
jgi:tol-pal system protein YbgF